jgi:hypothetical protein
LLFAYACVQDFQYEKETATLVISHPLTLLSFRDHDSMISITPRQFHERWHVFVKSSYSYIWHPFNFVTPFFCCSRARSPATDVIVMMVKIKEPPVSWFPAQTLASDVLKVRTHTFKFVNHISPNLFPSRLLQLMRYHHRLPILAEFRRMFGGLSATRSFSPTKYMLPSVMRIEETSLMSTSGCSVDSRLRWVQNALDRSFKSILRCVEHLCTAANSTQQIEQKVRTEVCSNVMASGGDCFT